MYHIHLTDSGTSPVSAALLFAHLSLRCGTLRDRVCISASSIGDGSGAAATNQADESHMFTAVRTAAAEAAQNSAGGSHHLQRTLEAAAILRGCGSGDAQGKTAATEEREAAAATEGGLPADIRAQLVPYPFLSRSFAEAERSLYAMVSAADATANDPLGNGYFDIIVAADLRAFDCLVDYYTSRRLGIGGDAGAKPFSPDKHVALLHLLTQEPARAGPLLQRFLHTILPQPSKVCGNRDEDGNGEEEDERAKQVAFQRDAWMDNVDNAMVSFSQLLGVDVLLVVL